MKITAGMRRYVKKYLKTDQIRVLKNIFERWIFLYRQLNTFRYIVADFINLYSYRKRANINNKKVSIIVPTLSKGKQADHLFKLKKLLSKYLPNQGHKNYEVIVWCDGPNAIVEEIITSLKDKRIRVYSTGKTIGKWGHPQTRMGIEKATGDFFVRMNDDNVPHRNYLSCLLSGFDEKVGIVYGRVVFDGEARRRYEFLFSNSFVIPRDKKGELKMGNIDCMCYMVRMNFAKQYAQSWNDEFSADWFFLQAMLEGGVKAGFINKILGKKL